MKYEETPFGTKIVGLEDAIKAAVSDMMSWEELADRVLELEDQLTTAAERERVLREALERYVSKFGNCGDVYDQARAALA